MPNLLLSQVNEYCVPREQALNYKKITAEDIVSCQDPKGGQQLFPDDIIVQNMKIDYCKKDKNPVDHVYFFQDAQSIDKFHIPKDKVSSLLPEFFLDRRVRLFVKDEEKFDAASKAFESFQTRRFGKSQQAISTPPRNGTKVAQFPIRSYDPPAKKRIRCFDNLIK